MDCHIFSKSPQRSMASTCRLDQNLILLRYDIALADFTMQESLERMYSRRVAETQRKKSEIVNIGENLSQESQHAVVLVAFVLSSLYFSVPLWLRVENPVA